MNRQPKRIKRVRLLCSIGLGVVLALGGCSSNPAPKSGVPGYVLRDIAPVSGGPAGPHPNFERWHP